MTKHHYQCVTCHAECRGNYCPACGEKRIEHHDLSLWHFAAHGVEAFTHADGKVFRTVHSLLARPGEMTADYVIGRRRPYMGPLQLFLICNVIYFLLVPVLHWDSLSSTLSTNMELSLFKAGATHLVEAKLHATGQTVEAYRPIFDHAAILHGKSLVILLVPLFALAVALLFRKSKHPPVTHLVFAFHFVAIFLLGLLASHALINVAQKLFTALGHPLTGSQLDWASSLPLLIGFGVYLNRALRRAYGIGGRELTVKTALLLALIFPIVTLYRLALFAITLSQT
jgi:hypothetical protein